MRPILRPAILLVAVAALLLAACEKPDASFTTSPSARTLLGVTKGVVAFAPPERAPGPKLAPAGWGVDYEPARFSKLENETPSIQVVLQVRARDGASLELWLEAEGRTIARWSGGRSQTYSGTVCFQLLLKDGAEVLALPNARHQLTLVFRDQGEVIYAKTQDVASFPPQLAGAAPGPDSKVFRDLLSCPRGS